MDLTDVVTTSGWYVPHCLLRDVVILLLLLLLAGRVKLLRLTHLMLKVVILADVVLSVDR